MEAADDTLPDLQAEIRNLRLRCDHLTRERERVLAGAAPPLPKEEPADPFAEHTHSENAEPGNEQAQVMRVERRNPLKRPLESAARQPQLLLGPSHCGRRSTSLQGTKSGLSAKACNPADPQKPSAGLSDDARLVVTTPQRRADALRLRASNLVASLRYHGADRGYSIGEPLLMYGEIREAEQHVATMANASAGVTDGNDTQPFLSAPRGGHRDAEAVSALASLTRLLHGGVERRAVADARCRAFTGACDFLRDLFSTLPDFLATWLDVNDQHASPVEGGSRWRAADQKSGFAQLVLLHCSLAVAHGAMKAAEGEAQLLLAAADCARMLHGSARDAADEDEGHTRDSFWEATSSLVSLVATAVALVGRHLARRKGARRDENGNLWEAFAPILAVPAIEAAGRLASVTRFSFDGWDRRLSAERHREGALHSFDPAALFLLMMQTLARLLSVERAKEGMEGGAFHEFLTVQLKATEALHQMIALESRNDALLAPPVPPPIGSTAADASDTPLRSIIRLSHFYMECGSIVLNVNAAGAECEDRMRHVLVALLRLLSSLARVGQDSTAGVGVLTTASIRELEPMLCGLHFSRDGLVKREDRLQYTFPIMRRLLGLRTPKNCNGDEVTPFDPPWARIVLPDL
eukprot:Polyplicarium_translucidae@DN3240_c0_g1_i2.p1